MGSDRVKNSISTEELREDTLGEIKHLTLRDMLRECKERCDLALAKILDEKLQSRAKAWDHR